MERDKGIGIETLPKVNFLGLSISIFDLEVLEKYLISIVTQGNKSVCYGHSLGSLSMIRKFPEIFYCDEKADLMVTDGRLFFLMAKLHGLPLKTEISIPNLVLHCLKLADKNSWSVFLLGATENTNMEAQQQIISKYRNIKKTSGHHGYFEKNEKDSIICRINSFSPSILLVGISSPGKERIAIEWKDELNANIIILCGGMIDVLAQKTKLTPSFIKKIGLASIYRLLQEPKRLAKRYLYIYSYLMLKFLPLYFYHVIIKRNKRFSLIQHYNLS